jgi:hypothetical protein
VVPTGLSTQAIDLKGTLAGMYLLRLASADGVIIRPFVVQ